MSKFTDYPEIEGVDLASNKDVAQESGQLDKIAKQLKVNNKLMKRLIKTNEKRAGKKEKPKKSGFFSFIKKYGKEIINAISKLLNTIASDTINGIYNVKVVKAKAMIA